MWLFIAEIHPITQGNKINFFPVAKTSLTFFLVLGHWFVLIFVVEGKF